MAYWRKYPPTGIKNADTYADGFYLNLFIFYMNIVRHVKLQHLAIFTHFLYEFTPIQLF